MFKLKTLIIAAFMTLGLSLLAAGDPCAVPAPSGHQCTSQIKIIDGKNGWYAAPAGKVGTKGCWEKIGEPQILALASEGKQTPFAGLKGIKAFGTSCEVRIFEYATKQTPVPGGQLRIFDEYDAGTAEWICAGQKKDVWGKRILEPWQECPDDCAACKGEESAYAGWLFQW